MGSTHVRILVFVGLCRSRMWVQALLPYCSYLCRCEVRCHTVELLTLDSKQIVSVMTMNFIVLYHENPVGVEVRQDRYTRYNY